jgi:replicative superfamily II helicase
LLYLWLQELTGDIDIPNFNALVNVDIIYTTPEKLDAVTRRKKDCGSMSFYSDISLLLIGQASIYD